MINDEILACDLSLQLFTRATEYGTAKWSQKFVASMWNILRSFGNFESPLEVGFFVWWYVYAEHAGLDDVISMQRQVEIKANSKTYRLDFAIYPMDWPELGASCDQHEIKATLIAVELDGHEFHERTKEQVIARDKRDRDLHGAGWRVLHYSGSEFVKDPEAVLAEVCSAAVQAACDTRAQIMKLDGRSTGRGVDIA